MQPQVETEVLQNQILAMRDDAKARETQLTSTFDAERKRLVSQRKKLQLELSKRWSSGKVALLVVFLACLGAGVAYFVYKHARRRGV